MNKSNEGCKLLIQAVLRQAVKDYRILLKHRRKVIESEGNKLSKYEVEQFFKSEWCDELLGSISDTLDGRIVMQKIRDAVRPDLSKKVVAENTTTVV